MTLRFHWCVQASDPLLKDPRQDTVWQFWLCIACWMWMLSYWVLRFYFNCGNVFAGFRVLSFVPNTWGFSKLSTRELRCYCICREYKVEGNKTQSSQHLHFLWFGLNKSLNLQITLQGFFICKSGLLLCFPHYAVMRIKWVQTCKALNTCLST